MAKKSFGVGVALGALLGGLVAYFYSPASGEENRKKAKKLYEKIKKDIDEKPIDQVVEELYGKASVEGKKLVSMAYKEVHTKLDELQTSLKEIDQEKYRTIVEDSIKQISAEAHITKDRLVKLKNYLLDRWQAE